MRCAEPPGVVGRASWLAVAAAVLAAPAAGQSSGEESPMGAPTRIELAAKPFDLSDVRLLEGPFRDASERNGRYLLALEPDRFLHNFRKNAGLEPKAPIYAGWESAGVAGHTLGHYLSACAMTYAATGDRRFRERVDYIVDELALCQSKRADGFVGAIPDADRVFGEVAAGKISSKGFDLNGCWVPWYTLHKLFAGLIDAERHCSNDGALEVARKLADWEGVVTRNLTDDLWQKMLACEHGGMNESLADLYALTGEAHYLDLARRFRHRRVLDRLARGDAGGLPGLHSNTQIPKVIGAARIHELTGEEEWLTIARTFWEAMVRDHTYAIGGNSLGEHLGPPGRLADRIAGSTCETCNTYNMLRLTKKLFEFAPSAALGDYYERALYNHILASQDPDTGMVTYFVPLAHGSVKKYSTPFDSFWCCVGTGIENHARYGEAIYLHSDAELWVNLFVASELRWRAKGVTVRQETRFPGEGSTRLTFECVRPVELAVRVRRPAWAETGPAVRVNGERVEAAAGPEGYVRIAREWSSGDRLEVSVPMGLRLEPTPDNPKRVAIMYGPIVLAGDLGKETEAVAADPSAPIQRATVLVTGGRPPAEWLGELPRPRLEFRTRGVGRPDDVTLVPFYRMHHRRYSVYWDVFTEEEWAAREAEYRAEEERRREIAARTIDVMRIGEMQPERDHNLQGEKTSAGEHLGRKWRHALDGGWFSFELGVPPDGPVDLVCTYWGSETGPREFDVLVDGEQVATQKLAMDRPGEFFDVVHPLDEALTRGKERVTVRLQAHPGKIAGGIFGCRTVRRGE